MTFNCPQCGDALALRFKYSKLTRCDSCQSTIFLEDETVLSLGQTTLLVDEPTLLSLHHPFVYEEKTFRPIGKIRYVYTLGFWEEWLVLNDEHKAFWISIDEGDMVIEEPLALGDEMIKTILTKKYLGAKVTINNKQYWVTEKAKGTCQGFEGELDRRVKVGEILEYMHLTARNGNEHITLEREGTDYSAYVGQWLDMYEVKVHDV